MRLVRGSTGRGWRAWSRAACVGALLAMAGCDGCGGCGSKAASTPPDAGFEPPVVSAPSVPPAPAETVRAMPNLDASAPSRGRPDASNISAAIESGRASDLQSNAEHLAQKARLCYRLTGPSGKTSLGGVALRVEIAASGDVAAVTPERVEVDKVVLDCIVANVKRGHFETGGAPAVVTFDVTPP